MFYIEETIEHNGERANVTIGTFQKHSEMLRAFTWNKLFKKKCRMKW